MRIARVKALVLTAPDERLLYPAFVKKQESGRQEGASVAVC
jgi:hypothetical protein